MFAGFRQRIWIPFTVLLAVVIVYERISQYRQLSQYTDVEVLDFILPAVLIFFIASGLAIFLAHRIAQPVASIAASARRIAGTDFTVPGELRQLSIALNHLSRQLQEQIASADHLDDLFNTVLQHIDDGVVLAQYDGSIRFVNSRAADILDAHHENIDSLSLVQLLRHHEFIELWRNSKTTDQPLSATLELSPSDRFIHAFALPLEIDPEGITLLLIRDLTRLHQLEIVRRDFVSNISHELRTPLASIKALAETLNAGALEDKKAAKGFLRQIDIEVDEIGQMVSELLELSRIESGQVPFQLVPTSPCDLIRGAADRLTIQAENADLQLHIDCTPNAPPILADPSRLKQVLINLIHNAIKFSPKGGVIDLRLEVSGSSVNFLVADSGRGIPADDLPRIFERFYKADRSRRGGGTGLGLAIAKHVVEAHGGEIMAQSVEGQGSTFTFTIPVSSP